jgi:GT2 family glycosyltransferase
MEKISPGNYYSSKRSPYYIYIGDYNERSSGIRVLHLLCHILNIHGYESYVICGKSNPELWTPSLTDDIINKHYLKKRKPIVIYPEVVPGTPLEIGVNVRYILNVPGFIGGTTSFCADELLFAYQDIFFGNTNCTDVLLIPASNPEKFRADPNNSVPRNGKYYYYNRLLSRGGELIELPNDVLEISPFKPRKLDELSSIFKSAELLYCYESSSIATEALLCGCPVVYLPNETMLPDFPKGPFGRDGAAWGDSPDEISRAKKTIQNVSLKYLELFDEFHVQFENFIRLTQAAAERISFERCFPVAYLKRKGMPIIGDPMIYWSEPGTKIPSIDFKDGHNEKLLQILLTDKTKFKHHITVAVWLNHDSNWIELGKLTKYSLDQQIRKIDKVNWINIDNNFIYPNEVGWTLLLCSGDTIEPDAILILEKFLYDCNNSALSVGYFDHDEYLGGFTHNPHFKPNINYELLLSYPYISRSIFVRNDVLLPALTRRGCKFDLALSYDIALKAFSEGGSSAFFHVPYLLGHLQPSPDPVFAFTSESRASLALVLQEHLKIAECGAVLQKGPGPGTFNVLPPLIREPLVSIIIPARDRLPLLARCIESLFERTNYPNFEILIVDNDSQTTETRGYLRAMAELDPNKIRVLSSPGPSNFSRMNNLAVAQARGEFILMLNNDTAALHPDWLGHMMRHALRKDVGIVGARLISHEGKLQHSGMVIGLRGPADHPCLSMYSSEPGYLFRNQVTQNFSAVTAACMLVSKALYQEVCGLDEDTFGVSYNDVDFCLRVGETGRRIVWTPLATLLHEGSGSQRAQVEASTPGKILQLFSKEQAAMYQRWPETVANDPAYNPNLSLVEKGYEIETNPLLRFNKLQGLTPHRVVAFSANDTGCGHYRVRQPMQAMLDEGLCTGGTSPVMFGPNLVLRSGADRLVFQLPSTDDDLTLLSDLLPLKDIKKIFELDDIAARVVAASQHTDSIATDIRARTANVIRLCDRLVVSTQALAQELRGKNDDIRVVENRLPHAMWGTEPPTRHVRQLKPGTKPRVAWAYDAGHHGDLEIIFDVVRDLADKVDWVFVGMLPEAFKPYVREFDPGVPTLDYPKHLMRLSESWDLAIAPLELNAFNECKSNLKLLEYGWCGVPVVCSDITPYQGNLPCKLVKNRYLDWRNAILTMVSDLVHCHSEGLRLQSEVKQDWMLDGTNLQSWYEAWTD